MWEKNERKLVFARGEQEREGNEIAEKWLFWRVLVAKGGKLRLGDITGEVRA
jgi:hypothetical protein